MPIVPIPDAQDAPNRGARGGGAGRRGGHAFAVRDNAESSDLTMTLRSRVRRRRARAGRCTRENDFNACRALSRVRDAEPQPGMSDTMRLTEQVGEY